METVGAYEAKTHLPKLLERVTTGESIIITKHGVPIAVLQPYAPEKTINTRSVIGEMRKLRDSINNNVSPVIIREMIDEGRS